jgi:hypothetical protein
MSTPDDPDRWPTRTDGRSASGRAAENDWTGDLLAEPLSDPLADPELARQLAASGERPPGRRRAPLPVATGAAALWAAATTYLPLLLLTAALTGPAGARFGAMSRFAVLEWLLGYGVPVRTATDRITLVPLAVSALAGWRLFRAGVHASRAVGANRSRTTGLALVVAAGVGAWTALLAAGAAYAVSTPDLSASAGRAALMTGLSGFGLAAVGAIGHGRSGRLLARRIPPAILDVARTGVCAALFTVAAGAGIAGVALAFNGGEAATMLAATRGVAGQAGVTVLCLAYAPNVAMWGTAYLLGPGFAVGAETVVSPGDVLIGPLPGLPVLAGLPTVPLSGVGPVLLGVPVVAGICAGVLLARRRPGGWAAHLSTAALAGPVAGGLIQAAGFAAAGGLGSGRLAVMGPHGWRVGLFATIVLTAGALIGVAAVRTLSGSPGASTVDTVDRGSVDRSPGAQGRGHPADARALRDPLPGNPGRSY